MATTFSERLNSVLHRGNLTVADIARLLDRPHATVRGWVHNGLSPAGGPADVNAAHDMLGKLEKLLQSRNGVLVPIGLSPNERIEHVNKLRSKLKGTK